jgi:hypothetical protein
MTSTAFVASLVLAVAIGYPIRQFVGELPGIITLEAISLVAAVGISLLSRKSFDYGTLTGRAEVLVDASAAHVGGAGASAMIADPDPVR